MQSKRKPRFKYIDIYGNTIRNTAEISRLNAIGVPPGYHDVWLSDSPNSKVQAIGLDDRNRRQYIYNSRFTKRNNIIKYETVSQTLGPHIETIRRDIRRVLDAIAMQPYKSWEQPRAMVAIVIYLMDRCHFRIGNMKYVNENGSYGCSTLCRKHVKVGSNGDVMFHFVGKKGVINEATISGDKVITKIFKKLLDAKPSANQFIFTESYDDNEPIGSDEINSFLGSYNSEITPKMFRTWNANVHFINRVRTTFKNAGLSAKILASEHSKRKFVNECCKVVSQSMHNTASVLRKNYVSTELINKTLEGGKLATQLRRPPLRDATTTQLLMHLI